MSDRGQALWTPPFVVTTAAAFAYFTSYAMLIPALPRFVEGPLGGGTVAVGIVIGAFGVTALVLRPFAGILGDRRGRRALLLVGTGSVALATAVIPAVGGSVAGVLVLRLIAGAGEAMFFVGAASIVTDLAPDARRGEALSLFSIALYGGIAVGPFLAEWMLDRWDFDAVFLMAAGLAGTAFLLAVRAPETKPPGHVPTAVSVRNVLHPAGVFPGLVMVTSVFGFAGYMAFVPLYVDGLSIDGVRGLLLMYGGIMIGLRLFGARIPDRFGAARVGKVGLAASALGLAIIAAWGSVPGLIVGSIVFASGQALAFPAFMALAATTAPPSERAAAVGTTTAFIDLGFFIGPVSFGAVAAGVGLRGAFGAGAAVAAAGVVFQIVAGRRRRAPAAAT